MVKTSSGEVNIPCTEISCKCGYNNCVSGDFICPKCGARYKATVDGYIKIGI